MLLFLNLGLAAQTKRSDHPPHKTDIKTQSFEVLDINFDKGFVALKQVYKSGMIGYYNEFYSFSPVMDMEHF